MADRLRLHEGWASFFLLLLLLLTMASSFEQGLAEGLSILSTVVLIGALLGFAFAKSRLPGFLVHPLGLVAGIAGCFLLLSSLIALVPDTWLVGPHPNGWFEIYRLKWLFVGQRLGTWLSVVREGRTSRDTFPFVAQMAALSWLMSFYGAWFLFRSHKVWLAILPGGLATFLSVYYAPPRMLIYFVLYLLWSLLLIVRFNVYRRESDWQRQHVVYEPQIGLTFMREGALLALIVTGLIWLVPRPTPGQVGDYWQRLQSPVQRLQQEWRRLYASITYKQPVAAAVFGREVNLTGALNLSREVVMEVQAPRAHYWRAMVLDKYTGKGWLDTSPTTWNLGSGIPLSDWTDSRARDVMTQTVTLVASGERLLFAAGEPLQVQLGTRVSLLQIKDKADPDAKGHLEISAIYAQNPENRYRYVAHSLVSLASVRSLREASPNYPDWLAERYLQLPEGFSEHIRKLAIEVAGDQPTAYDKAVTIEHFLRQLKYNQSIKAPPPGRDPVEWFLFDGREGYCTYFASAMVLMCRAAGVPARFAQGYAAGEFVNDRQAFVVREADAHAWPEVYFPEYGWIDFEPTPSQSLILRSSGEESGTDWKPTEPQLPEDWESYLNDGRNQGEDPLGNLDLGTGTSARPWPWREILLVSLLAAATFALGWRYRRRWLALQPGERLYLRLTWSAPLVGVRVRSHQTPFEFGHSLADALGPGRDDARSIVQIYVRECFARGEVPALEMFRAENAWRRLRPVILVQSLRYALSFRWRRLRREP